MIQMMIDPNHPMIFLDMDGVICNFIGAVESIYSGATELQKTYYGSNRDKPQTHLIQRYNDFTNAILNKKNFWRDLEWMPDGKQLVSYVVNRVPISNIGVITAPMKGDEQRCHIEKRQWISNNIPFLHMNNFHIERYKHMKINNDFNNHQILIDDRYDNIDEWNHHGGLGILHKNTKNTIEQLEKVLYNTL